MDRKGPTDGQKTSSPIHPDFHPASPPRWSFQCTEVTLTIPVPPYQGTGVGKKVSLLTSEHSGFDTFGLLNEG